MSAREPFEYAVVRVVPRVDRGESVNAGVILYCQGRDFLGARMALDHTRLRALAPGSDVEEIERALALIPRVCAGGDDAGAIGALAPGERFRWLVAPRSTVVQPSPVHGGLCHDPALALEQLLARLVL